VTHRLGFWAASGLAVVGVAYAGVVAMGIAETGLVDPIVDPVLAVMEMLTLLAAPLVVILMAAVHGAAAPDRKALGLIALSFAVIMAGLTSGVHFTALTAGRQTGFTTLEWPSTAYALELLAWDVFLGLSLLFASPVFVGNGVFTAARWSLALAGVLCLVGALGPITGKMMLQRIGILGYGVGLPVSFVILARVFRRGGLKR
jgi:hypothetical protein